MNRHQRIGAMAGAAADTASTGAGRESMQLEPGLPVTSFDRAIALENNDAAGCCGVLDHEWWGAIGPSGGYLAAILAAAAESVVGARQSMRSLTVHYLQSASPGPFELHLVVPHATRAMTTVQMTMSQGDSAIVSGLASLAKGRAGEGLNESRFPCVPAFEDVEISQFLLGQGVHDVAPPFARKLEYRHCLGPAPLSGGREARTGGWLRMLDERPLDVPAAAMMMDAWWPAVWSRMISVPRTPTLDLTVHFRRALPPTTEPVLIKSWSQLGEDGYVDEQAELWSADGQLLVQSEQLSLLLAAPGSIPLASSGRERRTCDVARY